MKKLYTLSSLALVALYSHTSWAQMQEFTSSGVFTVPTGVTEITVEVIGAGGSGGGNGSGGGGGGGYSSGTFTVSPGSSHIVTIGAGGSETATTFGMLITATAGQNGTSVPNPTIGGGGTGGTGSGGSMNHTGGTGGGGYWTYFGGGGAGAAGPMGDGNDGGNTIAWTGVCITPGGNGGAGGGAPGGDGGKGAGFTDSGCNVSDPAVPGSNYGAGGGGGNGNGGGPGDGAGGYCKVTWTVTTGISQAVAEKIEISPNPFTGKINVQHAQGDEVYTLLGNNGQEIWKGTNITQQDFSALGAGPYFLQVQSKDKTETIQLLKK